MIPPQTSKKTMEFADSFGSTVKTVVLVVSLTTFVMSICLSVSLQNLLGLVKQLQIYCHMMLINVQTPPNVTKFYGYIF